MTTALTPALPLAQQLLELLIRSGFVEQRAKGQRLFKCFTGEHAGKTFVMRQRPDKYAFEDLKRVLTTPVQIAPALVVEPSIESRII
jgi:hypothetical protein